MIHEPKITYHSNGQHGQPKNYPLQIKFQSCTQQKLLTSKRANRSQTCIPKLPIKSFYGNN
uniref:Uncharacterized protein n=1 Tax=Rhizophora mucronata TaxID=61149 RepID=A0A2P2LLV4_RHIMU